MKNFKNIVAIITGGAQGIGKAFAKSLLENGGKVAICDMNAKTGNETLEEFNKFSDNVIFLKCDVTDVKNFESCFVETKRKFGKINLVCNNAGIVNETDSGWRKVTDVNFIGVVVGTKLGFKYMSVENGGEGGIIVNTASITTLSPFSPAPVYAATKAAVNQLSRSYGEKVYFDRTKVKVMSINPGMTDTAILKPVEDIYEHPSIKEEFHAVMKTYKIQNVKNMEKGLLQVLEKEENGSIWLIEDDEPAKMLNLTYDII